MSYDLESLTPKPSNWFSTVVEYEGWGRAEFEAPAAVVEGPVQVTVNDSGDCKIHMDVTKMMVSGDGVDSSKISLNALLLQQKVQVQVGGIGIGLDETRNPCSKLTVNTDDGVFLIIESIRCYLSITTIIFSSRWSQFDAINAKSAMYWVIPLSNFLSDFRQRNQILDQHPLRVYPARIISNDMSQEDLKIAYYYANLRNDLICFDFNNGVGFIEALPDYKTHKNSLNAGTKQRAITAVIVGEVNAKSIDFVDLEQWFPFSILRLLGMATGVQTSSPWIEFRDEQGALVRRIHQRQGKHIFIKGHPVITENENRRGGDGFYRGIGYFLTKSMSSPLLKESRLNVTLRYVLRSSMKELTIEDRLSYLFRALDGLCEEYGVSKQNLRNNLDSTHQAFVKQTISTATQTLQSAAKSLAQQGDFQQAQILNRIQSRMANVDNNDVAFGLAVTALLNHFNMPDTDIVNAYYHANPLNTRTWASVLSSFRGTTLHYSYFDFVGNGDALVEEALTIMYHLQDILIRIVLKLLDFDGTYESPIPKRGAVGVNWVKPTTSANELGYK